jgi:hypothetical protein
VQSYESEQYAEALEAFQDAYRLAPHPSVLVNLANCFERLDRPVEAVTHFERFLAEAPDAPAAQRREVETAIERVRQQVGAVRLAVEPAGAEIRFDGRDPRQAPLTDPVVLATGNRVIEVALEGYSPVRREIIIAPGVATELVIELEPAPQEPVAAVGVVEGADHLRGEPGLEEPVEGGGLDLRVTTPTLIVGAASAALLVGAIITGVVALGAQSDFDEAHATATDPSVDLATRQSAYDESVDAADRADVLAIVTDILGVASAIGFGVTAYFFITDQGDDESEQASGVELSTRAVATTDGGRLLLEGRF